MRSLFVAIRCLTILPVAAGRAEEPGVVARSRYWYPAVGLLIGLLVGSAAWFLRTQLAAPLPAAALAVAVWLIATGALHLDGLADSFDGLFAAGGRERRLEILRDPHLGTFGAAALVINLLVKATALEQVEMENVIRAVVGAAVAGRAAMLVVAAVCQYPRSEGTGKTVIEASRPRDILWAIAWMLGTALALSGPKLGLQAVSVVCLVSLVWGAICRRRLGGATGDCLGAVCELSETLYLLLICLPRPIPLI